MTSSLTPFGQSRLDLREPGLRALDHFARVLPVKHHHHPDHDFAAAVARDGPLPRERRDDDCGDIPDEDRRAVGLASAGRSPSMSSTPFRRAMPADKSLLAVMNDVSSAGRLVVLLDAAKQCLRAKAR